MTHVLVVALVSVLVAWGGPAAAQAPTPMAAAVGGNMNHVPSFVGVEKGIFLKHGIDQKPELVERYVTAMAEATQWTRQHLDEAAEIATRWVAGLDVAVARQAIRHMTFDARITPHTVAAWEENVRILMEQKKLKTALPWQQGVELRFIDKVVKAHPRLFSDLRPVP